VNLDKDIRRIRRDGDRDGVCSERRRDMFVVTDGSLSVYLAALAS